MRVRVREAGPAFRDRPLLFVSERNGADSSQRNRPRPSHDSGLMSQDYSNLNFTVNASTASLSSAAATVTRRKVRIGASSLPV